MRGTAIQYVGIDVHQATLVCAVKDERGRTIIESKVATQREAIVAFLRGLSGRLRVAFEEGTQAQWLYDLIRPLADDVIVCDPRRIATKGNKGDRLDADRLRELLRLNALTPVFHRGGETRKLKELVRLYEGLVDDSTRVMLRIRAVYRGRAIGSSTRSVYHPAKRSEWLEQISEPGARYRVEALYKQLARLSNFGDARSERCSMRRGGTRPIACCVLCRRSVRSELPSCLPSSAIRIASGPSGSCGRTQGWRSLPGPAVSGSRTSATASSRGARNGR